MGRSHTSERTAATAMTVAIVAHSATAPAAPNAKRAANAAEIHALLHKMPSSTPASSARSRVLKSIAPRTVTVSDGAGL